MKHEDAPCSSSRRLAHAKITVVSVRELQATWLKGPALLQAGQPTTTLRPPSRAWKSGRQLLGIGDHAC